MFRAGLAPVSANHVAMIGLTKPVKRATIGLEDRAARNGTIKAAIVILPDQAVADRLPMNLHPQLS